MRVQLDLAANVGNTCADSQVWPRVHVTTYLVVGPYKYIPVPVADMLTNAVDAG